MRSVALMLLGGVYIANYTANWIAAHSRFSPAAVFYIMQGWWVVSLSTVLLSFIAQEPQSIWRTLAIYAVIVSMVEGIQIPLCRIPVADVKAVPAGMNLCDYVTGLPVSVLATRIELVVLALIVGACLAGKWK